MREKVLEKSGRVSVVRIANRDSLYVRWWDPEARKLRWQSLRSNDRRVARRQAEYLNDLARRNQGLVPLKEQRRPMRIWDIMDENLERCTREKERLRYIGEIKKFCNYLKEVGYEWEMFAIEDLSEALVRDYVTYLRNARGQRDGGITHALIPIRQAARAAVKYGLPNPLADMRVRREDEPTEIQWVRMDLVLEFIERLAPKRPDLAAIAALEGLCGLRPAEAANLRPCDISTFIFEPPVGYTTVTVTKTATHTPKTRPSYRTIPICAFAARRLADWMSRVRFPEGADSQQCLFPTQSRPSWTLHALSKVMSRYMKEFGLEITPKAFRASFATCCEAVLKVPRISLDHYMGHVGPSAIRSGHYTARVIREMVRDIVQPLEKYLAGTAQPSPTSTWGG
jgi:integrase